MASATSRRIEVIKQERPQYISRWHQQRGIYFVTIYTQRGHQKPLEFDAELGVTGVATRTARPKHYLPVCVKYQATV